MGQWLGIVKEQTDDEFLNLYCPYNENFLSAFKANIPHKERYPVYNKVGNSSKKFSHWRVKPEHLDLLTRMCKFYFPRRNLVIRMPKQEKEEPKNLLRPVKNLFKRSFDALFLNG